MKYDSHQRDFLNVLPAVRWDFCVCVCVIFANCKDKLTALCKHAAGTQHTVPESRLTESNRHVTAKCKPNY